MVSAATLADAPAALAAGALIADCPIAGKHSTPITTAVIAHLHTGFRR